MAIFTRNLLAIAALLAASSPVSAEAVKWEPSLTGKQSLKVYCTSEGNVLSSDYDYMNKSGGIYYSSDNGVKWEKTNAPEWWYWDFCENQDYIWAAGWSCRVARSEDGGKSWMTLSYQQLAEEYMSDKELAELDYVQAYSITYDENKKRLFVAVFQQNLGVVYSDDNGETWSRTNPEGMLLSYDAEKDVYEYDCIYDVVEFKGDVYALGMYFHYKYDYATDGWSRVKDPSGQDVISNFLATSTIMGDSLYAVRAMEDNDPEKPFVSMTKDMSDWSSLPSPDDIHSNYINGLTNDGKYIYAASLYEGVFYTCDNGKTWDNFGKEGLPAEDIEKWLNEPKPTGIAVNDKYVYLCVFDAFHPESGVYRISKPATSSVKAITNEASQVNVYGNSLKVNTQGKANIRIIDGTGAVLLNVKGNEADLSSIPAGFYIYNVETDGKRISGKFIK